MSDNPLPHSMVLMNPGMIYTLCEDSGLYKNGINFVGTYVKGVEDPRTWKVRVNAHQTIRTFFPPSKKVFEVSCIEALHVYSFFKLIYVGSDTFYVLNTSTGTQVYIK